MGTGVLINSVSHIALYMGVCSIFSSTGNVNGGQYFSSVDNSSNGAIYMVGHGSKGLKIELNATATWETSALLQISSTTKGFLPPRMTTTQKNAISTPAAGLVVYDTTTNKLCCYNGTTWNDLF